MASIKSRGTNKWFVRVFLGRDSEGRIKFHDKLIHGNKKAAENYAHDMEKRRDLGLPLEQPKLTLSAYLDKWMEEAVRNSVRESTHQDYKEVIKRYLLPSLGKRMLVDIKPLDIQTVYNELRGRGLSIRTVQYAHTVLSSALNQAVGWQLITLNPAAYTRRPAKDNDELADAETNEIQVMTPEQAERFLDAAKENRLGNVLIFALATGMRPEEYFGLMWSDIDFDKGTIKVRRVVKWRPKSEGGGWYFMPPKTQKSRRTIRVTDSVITLLSDQKRNQLLQRLKAGPKFQQHDLVFTTTQGGPLARRNVHRRHMMPILEKAQIKEALHLYCLRHTFATLALADGIDGKEVSMMMGHSSVAFTQDRYQHVLPSMREATSKKLEALLFKRQA